MAHLQSDFKYTPIMDRINIIDHVVQLLILKYIHKIIVYLATSWVAYEVYNFMKFTQLLPFLSIDSKLVKLFLMEEYIDEIISNFDYY